MSEHVSRNQDIVLRGADQQETTRRTRNLLFEGPSERLISSPGPGASTTWPTQLDAGAQTVETRPQAGLRLQAWELHNRAAADITVGIGFRFRNDIWQVGDLDAGEGAAAWIRRATYQSRTATTWAAGFTEANNDMLVIVSTKPFNWISGNCTRASTGNMTSTCGYSDEAGTGWITPGAGTTFADGFTQSAGNIGAGETIWVWNPPHDWGTVADTGTLAALGIPTGMYAWRMIFTGITGTNDPGWTGIEIGSMKFSGEELAINGLWENEQSSWVDFDGDGVVAYFETLNAGHMVDFEVSPAG